MTAAERRIGHWAAGLALTALCIALAGWALTRIGERMMLRGAEQIAQGHAQLLRESAPGLEALLDGGTLDAAARDQLQRVRRWGEVTGFTLFDRQGRALLHSSALDAAPDRSAAPSAPAAALTGAPWLELRRPARGGDAFVVRVFVPLERAGRRLGVAAIEIDHSARVARMREAMAQASLVIGALLLALGTLLAWQLRRQRDERRRDAARLHWLTEHDPLSGAANRTSFQAALARLNPAAPGAAVLCIDLDRFKDINDAHGHAVGDAVLCEATTRLRAVLRQGDLLARVGSDEFAVLQGAVDGAGDVAALAQRIVDAMGEPYPVAGRTLAASASVGAALTGAGCPDATALMHHADLALARAKATGRGRFGLYDPALDRQTEQRRALAQELREAIDAGALAMHYQPIFAADGRSLLGYEALMRWPHPGRGMVPPNEFIPLAEATGLIEALGLFALERACAEAARWPGALTVSVNLSAAQFQGRHDLAALVQHCLQTSGLAPERLVLEITESLLMSDAESVVRTLNALALMHVHIAMDDFGTGYSSLGSLWRFPFDKVKIDRAFVKDLEHDDRVALVVRSIVALSHSLGMRVTAEGVETPAQAATLRRLGCDELQGFLLGRPAPSPSLRHEGAVHLPVEAPEPPDFDTLRTQPAPL